MWLCKLTFEMLAFNYKAIQFFNTMPIKIQLKKSHSVEAKFVSTIFLWSLL
jgi:hypothetical protein